MKQKLEIQIEITTCDDDLTEGTWHGHDTDGNLQSCVKVVIEERRTAIPGWSKAESDLYDEDGRVANADTSSGEFVCYREGLPR